jgi:hypothetical protein
MADEINRQANAARVQDDGSELHTEQFAAVA